MTATLSSQAHRLCYALTRRPRRQTRAFAAYLLSLPAKKKVVNAVREDALAAAGIADVGTIYRLLIRLEKAGIVEAQKQYQSNLGFIPVKILSREALALVAVADQWEFNRGQQARWTFPVDAIKSV